MNASAVIVAGGAGLRMREPVAKQYLHLSALPVLSHTLIPFLTCEDIRRIFLVVPKADIHYCRDTVVNPLAPRKPVHLIPGGVERQDSVWNGLSAEKDLSALVTIHDGVRPFVTSEQIRETLFAADKTGACILAVPVHDTLKQVGSGGSVEKTCPRENIWLAQTPQTFRREIIWKAHESAYRDGYRGTDDAELVERIGWPVSVVMGSRLNIKITTPEDLHMARILVDHPFALPT